jgi:hypothetical protein
VDERQTKIKEGAGLEESRINQDFLDFLQKWSTPVLILIVIVSGGWTAMRLLEQRRVETANNAFNEYEAVATARDPLPASLRSVADSYEGVRSVSALARLRLGDVHLSAARRGLEPAAPLDSQGNPENEADVLDEAGREDHLSRAASAYEAVLAETRSKPAKAILAVNALFGLAAVAESRGDMDGARARYEEAATAAKAAGLTGLPEIAQARIDSLGELPERPELPTRAELPVLPGFPAPDAPTPAPTPVVPTPSDDAAGPALPDMTLPVEGGGDSGEGGDDADGG